MTPRRQRPAESARRFARPSPTERVSPLERAVAGPPDAEWPALGVRIAVAAAVYSYLVMILMCVVALVARVSSKGLLTAEDFVSGFLFMMVGGAVVSFVAMCVVLVACIPVLFLVWGAHRLTGAPVSWPAMGAFCGALIALVFYGPAVHSLMGAFAGSAAMGRPPAPDAFILLAIAGGPLLATFCGQVGGAYGGLAIESERRLLGLPPGLGGQRRGSFSIRQLLGLMVVASVLFAALKAADLINGVALLLVVLWLAWQAIAYYPAKKLARVLGRRLKHWAFLEMPATPTSADIG